MLPRIFLTASDAAIALDHL